VRPTGIEVPRYEGGVIGLPDRAMVLSNSERRTSWCDRRWLWGYGYGYDTGSSPAQSFGQHGHDVLEEVFAWWAATDADFPIVGLTDCIWGPAGDHDDCPWCHGTEKGPVARIRDTLELDALQSGDGQEALVAAIKEGERLYRCLSGYLRFYGTAPPAMFRILQPECRIAAPVISPTTGKVYKSLVPVVREPEGWRLARATDLACDITNVMLPWYQIAKLDAVVMHRGNGTLWFYEHKFTKSAGNYARDLALDTQVSGYAYVLDHVAKTGYFEHARGFGGFVYDLVSSKMHNDPRVLKSGKISTDKRQTIPTWRWDAFFAANPHMGAADFRDFRDHLQMFVDPSLYVTEWTTIGPDQIEQYKRELFADAKRLASLYRRLHRSAVTEHGYPRTPLCRGPGYGCAYTSLCLQDSPEARSQFIIRPGLRWVSKDPLPPQKKEFSLWD